MNELENKLDKLLTFFVEYGSERIVPIAKIPVEFQCKNLHNYLSILESCNFIVPFSFDFKEKGGVTTFSNLYTVTPAGVQFSLTSSFVENARIKRKERQLFNFKHFTMGWDTAIAFFALIVAIIALFKSCQ